LEFSLKIKHTDKVIDQLYTEPINVNDDEKGPGQVSFQTPEIRSNEPHIRVPG
jgi:hypothetical protein